MTTASDPIRALGNVDTERLLRFYRQMTAIRLFEENVNELYTRALMPGLAHLYIGEEAIPFKFGDARNPARAKW